MFEEPPIYYILISLIFLIVFGALSMVTWLVWVSAVPFFVKLVMTALTSLLAAVMLVIYTISAE
jgi:hypothetical protein|uniref:Transmembrane protein n=1 Tax=Siphoviridae sp. ctSdk10 TaxID=2826345 RepID=A0A8S5MJW3_9CAUD|nr:MAG TPA: hypothetical protein [Siphoviridae sp. ctSdk10]